MVAVNYKKHSDFEDVNPNTNVVLAAFVTAQARLLLYSYIEKLGSRVFYFDTGMGKNNFQILLRNQNFQIPSSLLLVLEISTILKQHPI